jgi:hypothetical protein
VLVTLLVLCINGVWAVFVVGKLIAGYYGSLWSCCRRKMKNKGNKSSEGKRSKRHVSLIIFLIIICLGDLELQKSSRTSSTDLISQLTTKTVTSNGSSDVFFSNPLQSLNKKEGSSTTNKSRDNRTGNQAVLIGSKFNKEVEVDGIKMSRKSSSKE